MDYRQLDLDEYDISEGEKLENGIKQIVITHKTDRRFCEECLSIDVVKKCRTTRKVLDIVDKQPIHYIINRYRYRCNSCKCTFVTDNLYEPKLHVTPEFGSFIAQKMLQDSMSEKQVSKMYGVSTTYVSEAVHNYEQEFERGILAIPSCHSLAFYPFAYSNRIRCCVIGTDLRGKNMLVGILPDYASETILHFAREKVKDPATLKFVYCDLNPDVFSKLSREFPSSKVMIMHDRLIYHCVELNNDTGDGLFNEKNKHIKSFVSIIKVAAAASEPLGAALKQWWTETPEKIRSHFHPLWEQIKECLTGCENSSIPNEMKAAIDTTLTIIKKFRKDNVQFDIMVLKTWFNDKAVIQRVKRTSYGKYMGMLYVENSERNEHGIDIEKLKQLYLQ